MQIGYTEFSFGYAFTENLIRSFPAVPHGAPVFPNLVQEATLGYDVRVNLPGAPVFFQYKIPSIMKRATAKEISVHNTPISVPFFRMSLMRKDISRQHRQLIELERQYPNQVFYASPVLANIQDFNAAYNSATVHLRSALFSPQSVGRLPDNKPHHIAYEDGATIGYFCSEPREVALMNFDKLRGLLVEKFADNRYRSARRSSREVREIVSSLTRTVVRESEGQIEQRISDSRQRRGVTASSAREQVIVDLLVTREMARLDFGVEFAFAQPR